jgi:hypothetical protein
MEPASALSASGEVLVLHHGMAEKQKRNKHIERGDKCGRETCLIPITVLVTSPIPRALTCS